MQTTILGRTGLTVSRIAFGAGPVSGLMTGNDRALQLATLQRALDLGINWIDTAAGYGHGASETNLGEALQELADARTNPLHIATKVRIDIESSESIVSQVERGVAASLSRLKRERITLLQLHNGLTAQRGDEPASLCPADVCRPGGVIEALTKLQQQGLTRCIGLTGTGEAAAMREVIRTKAFDTIQLPYNMLNPSAGQVMPADFAGRNYGNILADCAQQQMGAMAIRVFAAGALLGAAPSAHTLKTPYFPLALYEEDRARAAELATEQADQAEPMQARALRFALAHPAIHTAIIGFGHPEHVTVARFSEPRDRS